MNKNGSENSIDKFFRHNTGLICLIDKDGIFLRLNPGWRELSTCNHSELEGKPFIKFIHPDDSRQVLQLIRSILKKPEDTASIKCRFNCKGIHYKWLKVTFTNLLQDNDFNGILASIQDISDRIQTEYEVIDKGNSLFDNLSSASSVYKVITDKNGNPSDYQFISVNKAYENLIQLKKADLIGKTLLGVFPDTEQVWLDSMEKVYRTGKTITLEDYAKEVDMYFELIIYRPKSDMIGLIGSDVTERKRAERLLQESEEKYRNIVEGLSEAYYHMILPEGTYKYFSPSAKKVFGYSPDEFLDNPLLIKKIIHPDFNAYFKTEFEKLLRGEVSPSYEYKIIDPAGEEQWIFQTNKGIFNEDGKIIAIEGLCRNVSRQKKAEESVQRSEAILQATLESMDDGVLIVNSEGIITHSNTVFQEMFSIPERIISQNDENVLITYVKDQLSDHDTFTRDIKKIYRSKSSTEDLLYLKDERIIERISYPLQKESPVKGRVWLFRNITEKKLNEENLRKFKSAIDNSMDGVYWVNDDGGFNYVNEQACKMLGYKREELLALKLSDLDPTVSLEEHRKTCERLHKNRKTEWLRLESRHLKKDGSSVPVEVSSVYFWMDNHGLLISYVKDISERELFEKELLKKQKLLEESHRLAKIGSWESSIGQLAEIGGWISPNEKDSIYWSDSLYKLFGIENRFEQLTPESFLEFVHPEDKHIVRRQIDATFKKGRSENVEFRIVRPDGSVRNVMTSAELIRNEDQVPIGMMGVVQDITQQKQTEQEIIQAKEQAEESEFFLHESQRAGKIGSYKMDVRSGNWISTETLDQIFGIPATYEKNVKGWLELIHPDDMSLMQDYLQNEVIGRKQPFDKEYRIIRLNDKEERWLHGSGKLISDEQGNVISMLGTIQDITEYKELVIQLTKARDKAEESDNLKTAFLANLSHEIRTPMNGILGFADLLKNNNLSEDIALRYLELIEQSGERMLKLINDLVDISKIEANQITNDLRETKLNKLIDGIYGFFRPQANQKGILLTYKKGTDDPDFSILVDKLKLEQVLTNLLNNALKFTREGRIDLKYELLDEELIFCVKDTGAGIPSGMEKTIFERFRQADHRYLKETEGSGLGLSISKAFVELMGGKIWVESSYGEGAEFFFSLPYKSSRKIDIEKEITTVDSITKEITILVAEDDEISFLYFEAMFSKDKVKLLHANNGEEAVKMLHDNPDVKIILMDLKMPVMNGLDATALMRKENPTIPIIAQTAYASESDKRKALDAGCDDYIAKPIKREVLMEKIEKALAIS